MKTGDLVKVVSPYSRGTAVYTKSAEEDAELMMPAIVAFRVMGDEVGIVCGIQTSMTPNEVRVVFPQGIGWIDQHDLRLAE